MCVCTHSSMQISPPAVHFSLPLWSLFMSVCVPPSKLRFLLRSPSVTFHAFLSPFLISACVFDSPSRSTLCVLWGGYQIFHHVTVNKVKRSTPFFSHLFSSAPVASQRFGFYLLSPACNLTVTPNPLSHKHFQVDWTSALISEFRSCAIALKPLKCASLWNQSAFDSVASNSEAYMNGFTWNVIGEVHNVHRLLLNVVLPCAIDWLLIESPVERSIRRRNTSQVFIS